MPCERRSQGYRRNADLYDEDDDDFADVKFASDPQNIWWQGCSDWSCRERHGSEGDQQRDE